MLEDRGHPSVFAGSIRGEPHPNHTAKPVDYARRWDQRQLYPSPESASDGLSSGPGSFWIDWRPIEDRWQ